jgi:hypothetical protein
MLVATLSPLRGWGVSAAIKASPRVVEGVRDLVVDAQGGRGQHGLLWCGPVWLVRLAPSMVRGLKKLQLWVKAHCGWLFFSPRTGPAERLGLGF